MHANVFLALKDEKIFFSIKSTKGQIVFVKSIFFLLICLFN